MSDARGISRRTALLIVVAAAVGLGIGLFMNRGPERDIAGSPALETPRQPTAGWRGVA